MAHAWIIGNGPSKYKWDLKTLGPITYGSNSIFNDCLQQDFQLSYLRENIAVVQQEVHLFSSSIIDNVAKYDATRVSKFDIPHLIFHSTQPGTGKTTTLLNFSSLTPVSNS